MTSEDDVLWPPKPEDKLPPPVLPLWQAITCPDCLGDGYCDDKDDRCKTCGGWTVVKVNLDELREWRP